MSPRWTYSSSNASRWKSLFDRLIYNRSSITIPLEGNGLSLTAIKVRVGDALKYLSDRDTEATKYKELKKKIRYDVAQSPAGEMLVLSLKPHVHFQTPESPPQLAHRFTAESLNKMMEYMSDETKPIETRRKIAKIIQAEVSLQPEYSSQLEKVESILKR